MFSFFHSNDSDLIKQALNGEERAYEQLLVRHEQHVRATVTGMLGSTPQAEEVAQDVFIRFFRKLNDFRGDSSIKTYLTRIAINLSLNEIKKNKRLYKNVRLLIDGEDFSENREKLPKLPADTEDALHAALQLLEPDFRVVVVLRMLDEYSLKETAMLLDLPPGTVASRLNRALKKLKDLLKPRL